MAAKHSDTYRRLIDELAEERRTGSCKDGDFVNAAMQWGIDHEDTARRWYARERANQVQQTGFVVHSELNFVGVSPDGLVGDDGLVEIKCPQRNAFQQVRKANAMPSRYRWQVQGQLWVCGRTWLDFVCFYPPQDGIIVRVECDRNDFALLRARCIEVNRDVELRLKSLPSEITSQSSATRPKAKPHEPSLASNKNTANNPPASIAPSQNLQDSSEKRGTAWFWVIIALIAMSTVSAMR